MIAWRQALLILWCLSLSLVAARGDDWPQWMGVGRDGVWRESGVVTKIPASGLPELWRAEVGLGYAGPAVAGPRVFVPDFLKEEGELHNSPSSRDELSGTERLVCLERHDRQTVVGL